MNEGRTCERESRTCERESRTCESERRTREHEGRTCERESRTIKPEVIQAFTSMIKLGLSEKTANEILNIVVASILYDSRLYLTHSWESTSFINAFGARMYEVLLHLDKESKLFSQSLLDNLRQGNVAVLYKENRFKWSPYWKKYEISENEIMNVKKIGNSNIKCKNCGSTNTNVEFFQTRSADEGMTKFFECLDCGNHWRR